MLIFANMLGPDCSTFRADWYVRKWLASGQHSADDTNSRRRQQAATQGDYSHLNSIFC